MLHTNKNIGNICLIFVINCVKKQKNILQFMCIFVQRYWEFVILFRRSMLAFLTTMAYLESDYLNLFSICLLVLFTAVHCFAQPFLHGRNNVAEGICLSLLVMILTTVNLTDLPANQADFASYWVSACILVPGML